MKHYFGNSKNCNYTNELAINSQIKLMQFMQSSDINFEGKTLPIKISPYIYTNEIDETCRHLFENFFVILKKVHSLFTASENVRSYFKLESYHLDLVNINKNVDIFNHLCRFDFMFDKNIPQIYETNTACPGGLLLTRIISTFAKETDLYKKLMSNSIYSWFPHQIVDYFVQVVSQSFYEKNKRMPVVALVNSRHNTLTNEMSLMSSCLSNAGINNEVCFVEDLLYINDKVYSPIKKLPLDVCFQKFDNALSLEGIAHFGSTRATVNDYISAIRDGRIIAINPFTSHYLTEQKSILAFLHDQEMQKLFTPSEQKIIKTIVPYTILKNKAHLKDFKHKDDWVMKKSLDTRGRNVILGSEISNAEWLEKLSETDSLKDNFVLQKRIPSEVVQENHELLYISHAAFLVLGKYVGMFPRFSAEPLTNVGRNGFLGIPLLSRNSI